jgi:4-coumarate--CoA ligase (photoactive yellow protein activation family)
MTNHAEPEVVDAPLPPPGPGALLVDGAARRRLVVSLIADEVGRQRRQPVTPAESEAWPDTMLMGEGDLPDALGLDSLARIDVAARLNQFFHLHEVGVEDYLLIEKTLGRWVELVGIGLERSGHRVTFQTSGSTGVPKACTHALAVLADEARTLAGILEPSLLGPARRVLAMVPPHHIYGLIFTVLLPRSLGAEPVDIRTWSPGRLAKEARAGDVLVATPHLWRYLATSLPGFPPGLVGTTSTAPMPPDLAEVLASKGLARLVQVYGSSETSGIGWRDEPAGAFQLFAHWRPAADGAALVPVAGGDSVPLGDEVEWLGADRLRPLRRRDGAVQVGGVNVFPDRVRDVLAGHPDVAEAAVRPFAVDGDQARLRLKAFVVPRAGIAPDIAFEAAIKAHAGAALATLERPVSWTFGAALPRTEIGKLADW